jgi:hypothetical protein
MSLKTEHTFRNEDLAKEAWVAIDGYGRQRNRGNTVAFREGCRVYLRPEFTSAALSKELTDVVAALEPGRMYAHK